MSLEEIERQIRRAKTQREISRKSKELESEESEFFEAEEEEDERKRPRFIFAGILIALFLAVAGAGVYAIFRFNESGAGVEMLLAAPEEVSRGTPFEFTVQINNRLDTVLRDGTLTVNFPSGVVSLEAFGTQSAFQSESVGDIGSGSLTKKTFKFLAVGEIKSVQEFKVTFSYLGGRLRPEITETKEVRIGAPAIQLEVKKPDTIVRGSSFDLELDYTNTSRFDFPDVTIEGKYPSAFQFVSASFPPDSLNNFWRLGGLNAGSSGKLTVKGTLQNTQEAEIPISFVLSVNFAGKNYPIHERAVKVAIAPSPIGAQIFVNGRTDYVARIGDRLTYTIAYQNMSGVALADLVIKASLSGELFDIGTLQTSASGDPLTSTLVWNAMNTPSLALVAPGAGGEVSATISLKNTFPIRRSNDKNFSLRANVQIESPTVPYYLSAPKTSTAASLDTKVAGLIAIDAQAFYRDAVSGIVNQGILPPRVGQATDYTIHWVIRNYATDVKNVIVRAFLQPGIIWTGTVKSTIDAVPLYNGATGEVVWTIERIQATKGVVSDPVEAIFQVRGIPSASQVGQFLQLLGETMLTAKDEFTDSDLSSRDAGLSTALPDDKTVGQDGGRVMP